MNYALCTMNYELNRDFGLNMRPRVIALQLEVFVLEVEERLDVGIQNHTGQGTRLAGELQVCLVEMVQLEVGVAGGVDEVASFHARHLCHHL